MSNPHPDAPKNQPAKPRKHDMKIDAVPYGQLREWASAEKRTPAAQLAFILECLIYNRVNQLHVPRTMLVKDRDA